MENKRGPASVMLLYYSIILFIMVYVFNAVFSVDKFYSAISICCMVLASAYVCYDLYRTNKHKKEWREYQNHPLGKFFIETNMELNGNYPQIVEEKSFDGYKTYLIEIPAGLSSEDFEKRRLAMEQYLRADITIEFKGNLFMTVIPKEYL